MSSMGSARRRVRALRERRHRYGVVFLLLLALVLFEVLAPSADWARAIDVALAAAALTVAVATARALGYVRRVRVLLVSGFGLLGVVGIAAGLFGPAVAFLAVTALVALIPVALINGLMRLIRQAGVTIQVVSGALAVYLVVGLLFASIIGFVDTVESGAYFKQGMNVTNGERVYYSFTVLTTTGFGDYTAAQPFGHALAVLEMLTGQLYLVTVIGIVVGNFAGRRMRNQPDDGGS
jgi:Ion channel